MSSFSAANFLFIAAIAMAAAALDYLMFENRRAAFRILLDLLGSGLCFFWIVSHLG